jgi:hypothetical protein
VFAGLLQAEGAYRVRIDRAQPRSDSFVGQARFGKKEMGSCAAVN